jgi:hypothetical protein
MTLQGCCREAGQLCMCPTAEGRRIACARIGTLWMRAAELRKSTYRNGESDPGRHVKVKDGQAFVDWLISPDGQRTIAEYKIEGRQLFFPDAGPPIH